MKKKTREKLKEREKKTESNEWWIFTVKCTRCVNTRKVERTEMREVICVDCLFLEQLGAGSLWNGETEENSQLAALAQHA